MTIRSFSLALLLAAVPVLQGCNDATTSPDARGAEEASISGLSFNAQNGNGPVYRNQVNGDFASYYASSWDWETGASTWVSLQVSRNGRGANADTWLYFSVERCIPTGEWWWRDCDWTSGYGSIPGGDFKGSMQGGFTLQTDTRSNPNLFIWGGEGGVISVRFSPTDWEESRNSGSGESRWLNTIWRWSGTSRSSSATATGTILGYELPEMGPGLPGYYGSGSIGSGQNVSMAFERRNTQQ